MKDKIFAYVGVVLSSLGIFAVLFLLFISMPFENSFVGNNKEGVKFLLIAIVISVLGILLYKAGHKKDKK